MLYDVVLQPLIFQSPRPPESEELAMKEAVAKEEEKEETQNLIHKYHYEDQ